jgi:hypothetical protein
MELLRVAHIGDPLAQANAAFGHEVRCEGIHDGKAQVPAPSIRSQPPPLQSHQEFSGDSDKQCWPLGLMFVLHVTTWPQYP